MSKTIPDSRSPIVTSVKIVKPRARPMPDLSKKFSLWSSKYRCTFYGNTKEDCERQLMEMDRKRHGEIILGVSPKKYTISQKSNEERKRKSGSDG